MVYMDTEKRIKAVNDVLCGSMTKTEVARKYGVSRQTITNWVKVYSDATSHLLQSYRNHQRCFMDETNKSSQDQSRINYNYRKMQEFIVRIKIIGEMSLRNLSHSKGRKKATESNSKLLSGDQKLRIKELLRNTVLYLEYFTKKYEPIIWEKLYKKQYTHIKPWTVENVREVITKRLKISLSYGVVKRMLISCGFIPRKKEEIEGYNKIVRFLKDRRKHNWDNNKYFKENRGMSYWDRKQVYRKTYFRDPHYITIYKSHSGMSVCGFNAKGHFSFIPVDPKRLLKPVNHYYECKYRLELAAYFIPGIKKNYPVEAFISPDFQEYIVSKERLLNYGFNDRATVRFIDSDMNY